MLTDLNGSMDRRIRRPRRNSPGQQAATGGISHEERHHVAGWDAALASMLAGAAHAKKAHLKKETAHQKEAAHPASCPMMAIEGASVQVAQCRVRRDHPDYGQRPGHRQENPGGRGGDGEATCPDGFHGGAAGQSRFRNRTQARSQPQGRGPNRRGERAEAGNLCLPDEMLHGPQDTGRPLPQMRNGPAKTIVRFVRCLLPDVGRRIGPAS